MALRSLGYCLLCSYEHEINSFIVDYAIGMNALQLMYVPLL
jgi:hypothetical protein